MKKLNWCFVALALLVFVCWLRAASILPSRAHEEGALIVQHLAEIRSQGHPLPEQLELKHLSFDWHYTPEREEEFYTLRCYVIARTSVVYFSANHSSGFKGWYLDEESGVLEQL